MSDEPDGEQDDHYPRSDPEIKQDQKTCDDTDNSAHKG